jgi:hypothetical protein
MGLPDPGIKLGQLEMWVAFTPRLCSSLLLATAKLIKPSSDYRELISLETS